MSYRRPRALYVYLILMLLLVSLPASSTPAAAGGGLQLRWQGTGQTLLDVHLAHVRTAGDGTITATVVLHPKFQLFYNLSVTRQGAVAGGYFQQLADAQRISRTETAFIPLPGGIDYPIGPIAFPPGTSLSLHLTRFGTTPTLGVLLACLDLGAMLAKAYGGVDIGKSIRADPQASAEVAVALLAALHTARFDMAAFARNLQQHAALGALQVVIQAIEHTPASFAIVLHLPASTLKKLSGLTANIVQAMAVAPMLADLTALPWSGSVGIVNTTQPAMAATRTPSPTTSATATSTPTATATATATSTPTVPPTSGFVGQWVNQDKHTMGIVGITITQGHGGLTIHAYGACTPSCTLGTIPLTLRSATEAIATVTLSFAVVTIHLHLLPGTGQSRPTLQVAVQTHFTDNSGRRDFTTTATMVLKT